MNYPKIKDCATSTHGVVVTRWVVYLDPWVHFPVCIIFVYPRVWYELSQDQRMCHQYSRCSGSTLSPTSGSQGLIPSLYNLFLPLSIVSIVPRSSNCHQYSWCSGSTRVDNPGSLGSPLSVSFLFTPELATTLPLMMMMPAYMWMIG